MSGEHELPTASVVRSSQATPARRRGQPCTETFKPQPIHLSQTESCSNKRSHFSQHWFASLSHMRSVLDNWRDDYNHHRGHSSLGYVPPAEFAARSRLLAGDTAQPQPSTTIQPPDSRAECY